MNSQKTPHTSPLRASHEASILSPLEKIYRKMLRLHWLLTDIEAMWILLVASNDPQ